MNAYVFGYGSLTSLSPNAVVQAVLMGFVRAWDVAMDNRLTIPGYKYYLDPATGERPSAFVTFLNIQRQPGSEVGGVLVPVDSTSLAVLDARERNYTRIDVTHDVGPATGERVYTYIGTAQARDRFRSGVRSETAVIDSNYLKGVEAGFQSLGSDALAAFRASTRPAVCRQRPLQRVDVPPDLPPAEGSRAAPAVS